MVIPAQVRCYGHTWIFGSINDFKGVPVKDILNSHLSSWTFICHLVGHFVNMSRSSCSKHGSLGDLMASYAIVSSGYIMGQWQLMLSGMSLCR